MNGERMTHPKHTQAPEGKRQKRITPKRIMPIGLRSAKLIRNNGKSAVIVPAVEHAWLADLAVGDEIHMPINFKGKGFLNVRVTNSCFHAVLALIPTCMLAHTPAQFDADADWHTVLLKAAWGSNRPVPTAEMDARAREGWYVIAFEPIRFPREWQSRAKRSRESAKA